MELKIWRQSSSCKTHTWNWWWFHWATNSKFWKLLKRSARFSWKKKKSRKLNNRKKLSSKNKLKKWDCKIETDQNLNQCWCLFLSQKTNSSLKRVISPISLKILSQTSNSRKSRKSSQKTWKKVKSTKSKIRGNFKRRCWLGGRHRWKRPIRVRNAKSLIRRVVGYVSRFLIRQRKEFSTWKLRKISANTLA